MRPSSGSAAPGLGHVAELGGEHALENGDIEFGRVGEMLEHGARRHAGHLGDVAHDRRDFAGLASANAERDDGFAGPRDTIAVHDRMRQHLPI